MCDNYEKFISEIVLAVKKNGDYINEVRTEPCNIGILIYCHPGRSMFTGLKAEKG